ncbi:MAG: hypothetical protein IPP74_13520 [Alphaproteobacteria bacterium]|nr:hypothetical protein [Alphaproteobacteria bacterium]
MKIKDRTNINKRYNAMKNEYSSWVPTWRDIARFVRPGRGFFFEQIPNWGIALDHKTMLDSVPVRAIRTMAAGMTSGLTSPSRPWFKLGFEDHELDKFGPVKEWLEQVQKLMMNVFSKSNIYGAFTSMYEECGAFGTAAMALLEDYDNVVRARTFTIGEYFLGQGSDGRVNSFGRNFRMTVGQLVEEFGLENCTESTQNDYKTKNYDKWVQVCCLIEPDSENSGEYGSFVRKSYRSIYWENGSPDDMCLDNRGFDDFPILAPRWDTMNTMNIYGKSPGWDSLGDCKMLMKMQNDRLLALDKVIDPPMQVSGSVHTEVNTMPGGVTRNSAGTPDAGVRPAYQINPDMGAIERAIIDTRQAIKETFYNDLFLMLSSIDSPQKTAYEIAKRYEEKLLMLGTVIERLESELHDPTIERTFSIMQRAGLIPPPPEEIQGLPMKVDYISTLAQAQKMVGTTSIEETLNFVGQVSAINPSVVDNIDYDDAVREYAEMKGVPPTILRTEGELMALRKAKEDQARAQEMAQAMPEMVKGAKTLSETKLEGNSALDAMVGNR